MKMNCRGHGRTITHIVEHVSHRLFASHRCICMSTRHIASYLMSCNYTSRKHRTNKYSLQVWHQVVAQQYYEHRYVNQVCKKLLVRLKLLRSKITSIDM